MTPATEKLLKDLKSAQWFSNCGKPVSSDAAPLSSLEEAEEVIQISCWEEVGQFGPRHSWEDTRLDAANHMTAAIQRHSWPRFQLWNGIVDGVKPQTEALIGRKCEGLQIPAEWVAGARWDLLHAAMQTEYADIPTPRFYRVLAHWYCAGHFPCAWAGEYPEGRLVIY